MAKHLHPFDDFLKEALKGHQLVPPEKAKKAFLKEASSIIPTRRGWNYWYLLPILAVFIAVIVAVLYYQNRYEPTPSAPVVPENVSSNSISDSPNSSLTPTPTPTSTSTSTFALKPEIEPNITGSSILIDNKPIKESESSIVDSELLVNNLSDTFDLRIQAGGVSQNILPPAASLQDHPVMTGSLFSKTTPTEIVLDSLPGKGTGIADDGGVIMPPDTSSLTPVSLPEYDKTPGQTRLNQSSFFTAGLYYLPEWMFNTLEDSKFVNNFGFEATYYRGQFSIRTGAGISISKGITKNAIEYNDYLGSYNKLDSITFTFNEPAHDFIPNLHMSSQKVWDSIAKLDSTNVIRRYTYLQIPLILGFDFWQQGVFSIGVRVGTIMSVLLNSKQLSEDYNPGENQLVGISIITPEQVSINWQAIGGINASARLTKNIYLEIEPQAKYYYQSIYEKSDMTKKPWSVGVRAAVIYKF